MLKLDNKKISVSWWDMTDLIKDLTIKIPFEVPLADSIYGIPRGGLIPAVMLSHSTGLPLVDTIGKNTLVVDDMTDSGVTMDKMPGQFTAVLYHKPHTSIFTPNVYSKLHEGDEWLVFPWEDFKAPAKQDYLQSDEFLEFAEREDNSVARSEIDSKLHTIGGLTNDKEGSFMKFQNKIEKNG
jgi:hypoxanthine phosphoribosyltransferase